MRSWYTAMPGEKVSCVGCHERATEVTRYVAAAAGAPEEIQPWRGPARGVSFARDLEPTLKRHCSACHGPDKKDRPNILEQGVFRSYCSMPRCESDLPLLVPGEYIADSSKVVRMIQKGHRGVKADPELMDRIVTWVDMGGPVYPTWDGSHGRKLSRDQHAARLEFRRLYAGIDADYEQLPPMDTSPVTPIVPKHEPAFAAQPVTCAGWPFDAVEAARRQKAAAAATERKVVLKGVGGASVSLDMVLIPPGAFVMGDPEGSPDERPAARVTIEKPFWMSRTEVTGAAFELFRASDPSAEPIVREQCLPPPAPSLPAVRVSWNQAMAFCQWVSRNTGDKCVLPTEAQWEYGCRAGSAAPGTGLPAAGKATARALAISPCGGGEPNAWGLCDMQGNAAEWTLSLYRPYPYADGDGRNDANVVGLRVVRGGSFMDRPRDCSATFRWRHAHWQPLPNVGFRIVIEADGKAQQNAK